RELRQLVDDPELLRYRVLREARPGAGGQFADKDVAAAVDGDAVRRGELPGEDPAMRFAEPGQHLALQRVDADPRTDIRPVLVDLARRATLADVAERVMAVSEAHAVWPVQIVPLGLPLAIAVEHL